MAKHEHIALHVIAAFSESLNWSDKMQDLLVDDPKEPLEPTMTFHAR